MSGSRIIAHLLNNNAAVTAIVPVHKQFLDDVEQSSGDSVTPPYILISDISGSDGVHLQGQDQYPRERVQVDSVHTGAVDVRNLCKAVNLALIDTIKRTITTPGTTGIRFKDVDIIEAGRPQSFYDDSRELRVMSQDFFVRWRYL